MSAVRCPTQRELLAFQAGELSEQVLSVVAAHLEVCTKCESNVRKYENAHDSILYPLRKSTTAKFAVSTRPNHPPRRRTLARALWCILLVAIVAFGLVASSFLRPPSWTNAGAAWEVLVEAEPVFLSDMKPIKQRHWPWTPPPLRRLAKLFGATDGDRVVVQHRPSPHGLFMHPPCPPFDGESASLSYSLRRQFSQFRAIVGLNDGPPPYRGRMMFAVYGDGELLWESQRSDRRQEPESLAIPIDNIDILTLEVAVDGSHRHAHAVWIEPCVIPKAKTAAHYDSETE